MSQSLMIALSGFTL